MLTGTRIVGVVDWENAIAGGPVNDFDALDLETELDFEAVTRDYGGPELFDDVFTLMLNLYRLLSVSPRCPNTTGGRIVPR